MSNPIEKNADGLARVLDEIELAAEQVAAWLDERDRLVVQAKALGGSHRQIASRAELSHTGVGKLIQRETRSDGGAADVG
ncbi:hypothetical protein [Amycolatopsis vastitatis]|uniref:Uncharacterized protein n=1 Tax=Amycolatopsis vastitatis TaxID=1905142 RepID=A0A229SWC5_9PSEU|nr:hypothetical protein [Amycolatopsis vastitatis]OXM63132.1 hypothetical protein CF165_32765 [Amycolatopsis vastitatis]